MDFWSRIDGPLSDAIADEQFTPAEMVAFEQIHDLAAYGQEDAPSATEAADGIVGGEALRTRVRAWRDQFGPA